MLSDLHMPRFYASAESKDIVIFIHGFMGSPRQFDSLAEAVIKHGFAAATLLLPGHGGCAKHFASGTFESWQSHVDSEVERFSHDYQNIWLGGHSMGGLLAINASVKFSGFARGIFAIACPFKLTMYSMYATKIRLKQLFSKKDDPIKAVYLANSSVALTPDLLLHSRKPGAEMKKLMFTARNNLPEVCVPMTAVYSTSDELTSIESNDILKKELVKAPCEIIILTESLHAYYTEEEREIIEQALIKLVSG